MRASTEALFHIAASGRSNTPQEWHEYFEAFHAELPHANELFTLMKTYSGFTAYEVLARAAASTAPQNVLDLGCGDGNLVEHLLDATSPSCAIEGIDVNETEIAIAANRYRAEKRVRLAVGDARDLPYADAAFDCVVAHQVLNLFPQITAVRTQVERVLRPGRELIFVANRGWQRDRTGSWMLLHDAAMSVITERYPNFVWPRMGDPRIYNEDGIREIFSESGAWEVRSLSMETFDTTAMMSPDRIASFYNRLYLFGTSPMKSEILPAVESRARELANGDLVAIDLPFRLVRVRRAAG